MKKLKYEQTKVLFRIILFKINNLPNAILYPIL